MAIPLLCKNVFNSSYLKEAPSIGIYKKESEELTETF